MEPLGLDHPGLVMGLVLDGSEHMGPLTSIPCHAMLVIDQDTSEGCPDLFPAVWPQTELNFLIS